MDQCLIKLIASVVLTATVSVFITFKFFINTSKKNITQSNIKAGGDVAAGNINKRASK
jgi:hypothetical protein